MFKKIEAMLNKADLHFDLLTAVAEKGGVDLNRQLQAGELSASGLRSAVMLCTHCTHVGECQSHLRDGPQGEVPGFCLNKHMFEHLKA